MGLVCTKNTLQIDIENMGMGLNENLSLLEISDDFEFYLMANIGSSSNWPSGTS